MDRAGTGAAHEILVFARSMPPRHARRFVVLAGKGNNGGDAWVVARRLAEVGALPVRLLAICPPAELPTDARHHAERLPTAVSCEIRNTPAGDEFAAGDILVDGLLGTGVAGAPRAPFDAWIRAVNAAGLPVVALDVPSGLDGNDGSAELAVHADLTLTMGLPKRGLIFGRGPQLCGRLRHVDIGIPANLIAGEKSDVAMTFAADIRPLLPRLAMDTHKTRRGRLLVIGGCPRYLGAPHLAARAALRGGAGLVTLALPQSAGVLSHQAAIIVRRVPDDGQGNFSKTSLPLLEELAETADAIVVGPGLGPEPCVLEMLKDVLAEEVPMVIDADALNLLAGCSELANRPWPTVLTPHPGEMLRLLSGFKLELLKASDRLTQARGLAANLGATVVLKGHRTVIAAPDHPALVNTSGCPALATAGSGDVLAGFLGAFLAADFPAHDAAMAAVFLHGLAGELWPGAQRSLAADDLVDLLSAAIREASPFG
jgi:NAD(P)H-hydrate epimerase